MALARERPLDQLIRLQEDEASHALRDPASEMKIRVGVRVARVLFDGKPFAPAEEALRGADVSLEGQTSCCQAPASRAATTSSNLGGRVDREGPWAVRYWFGGWDGDLLVGYMRGQLSFPFLPDRT